MTGAYTSEIIRRFLAERREFTAKEFIEYVVGYGISPGTARNWLVHLQYLKIIERIGRGKYRLKQVQA